MVDEIYRIEAAIGTFRSIKNAAQWMYNYAMENGLPALASSVEDVFKGAAETIDVLEDMKELSYPETKLPEHVIRVNFMTKEVIR